MKTTPTTIEKAEQRLQRLLSRRAAGQRIDAAEVRAAEDGLAAASPTGMWCEKHVRAIFATLCPVCLDDAALTNERRLLRLLRGRRSYRLRTAIGAVPR